MKRIGEVLVESGLINEDQLNTLLEDQSENPQLNLGEMAAKRYNIPLATVESTFVDIIVLPSVRTLLLRALTQELSRFVAKTDFQIESLNLNMNITEVEIARTVSSLFQQSDTEESGMQPSGKRTHTKIHGAIELCIHISEDITITPPGQVIAFTLDDRTGALTLDQAVLEKIKTSFRNAISPQEADRRMLDSMRKQELQEIIARYYK